MQTLRDKAYHNIRHRLMMGDLQAGSRMSVQSLASDMGISRQPVAEALRKLEVEHVIEQHARRGTVVRQPRADEVAELYELRELLECHAVARGIHRLSPTDFETMRQLVDQLRAICLELRHTPGSTMTPEHVRKYLAGDLAFHMLIVRASGNRRMTKIVEDVQVLSRIFGTARKSQVTLHDAVITYGFHARIYRALRSGNTNRATELLRKHIHRSRDDSVAYLINLEMQQQS